MLKKIIREDNFLSLAGNLIIALFGFAGFALLARSYSQELFGQWVLFVSSGAFIEMFRFGITNTALIRYLSGAEKDRPLLIGSNGIIALSSTGLIIILLLTARLLFPDPIEQAGYALFFNWYPLLAVINLPYNTALVILQADLKFDKILLIKMINSGGFFIVIIINFFIKTLSLDQLVIALLSINFIASSLCFFKGWDGFRMLRKASNRTTSQLLHFGKYTTFTLIGTNLLRSADTLIISLSPLGTAAVALYSIPLKLTEVQQIPLRSFAATAFPKMSKACIKGQSKLTKKLFYEYTGAMSILFLVVSLFTFILAPYFVLILGGEQYLTIDPLTGYNTVLIVQIFSLYGLILPFDRMTGIGLDAINKPGKNALKVFFMVFANIVGDLIAVYWFQSLSLVAIGSVFFTFVGIGIGYFYLKQELKINLSPIFTEGLNFYHSLFRKIRSMKPTL